MNFASNFAYISSKPRKEAPEADLHLKVSDSEDSDQEDMDLNVFVVTFEGTKIAEKQLSGGDPYSCQECGAILNKHSKVTWEKDLPKEGPKVEIPLNGVLWEC